MPQPSSDIDEFRRVLASSTNIVVLAGAGLSAASGIPTFRGPDGLWRNNDALKLVTPAAWRDDPSRIWRWANHRREMISKADPNPAHRAIALISLPSVRAAHNLAPPTARVTLVTQNIDELSTRALDALVHAGTVDPALAGVDMSVAREEVARAKDEVLEMHGNVWSVVCTDFACQHRERNHDVPITPALPQSAPPPAQDSTNARTEDDAATEAPVAAETSSTPQSPLAALHASLRAPPALRRTGLRPPTPPPPIPAEQLPRCVRCGALARPGEVWFGEAARHMDEVFARVDEADLCIVVGTSATIHPAAKFASTVKAHGGKVAVFNLGRTKGDDEADFLFLGPCEEWLPKALGVPVPAPASNA